MHIRQPPSDDLLNDFLKTEPREGEIPAELWEKLKTRYGEKLYPELLYGLTRMHFEQNQARHHWNSILAHRTALEKSCQRDMGLRVALTDYFINLNPSDEDPVNVEINLFLKNEDNALIDELTGLYNRRYFNHTLQQELERARRFNESVSIVMIDIDHFKAFNSTFGHSSGDQALVELAELLRHSVRSSDHLTRYGGEEFALILPKADRVEALTASERYRSAIEKHRFQKKKDRRVTASIGSATYPLDAPDGLQLVEKTDLALYMAKQEGRNRTRAYTRDKRQHERYPVELNMVFQQKNDRGFYPGQTRNVSAGGLLSQAPKTVDVGAELEFHLFAPDDGADFCVNGRCIRVRPDPDKADCYQLAAEFDLSVEEKNALKTWIADCTKALAAAGTINDKP